MAETLKIILVLAHLCALSMGQNVYEFSEITGHWYNFHTQGANWTDAKAICDHEGGGLAIINSAAEMGMLQTLSNTYSSLFTDVKSRFRIAIGFYKNGSKWTTIDGQTLEEAGYAKFDKKLRPGRSNFHGYMNQKGLVRADGSGKTAFICEKNSHP